MGLFDLRCLGVFFRRKTNMFLQRGVCSEITKDTHVPLVPGQLQAPPQSLPRQSADLAAGVIVRPPPRRNMISYNILYYTVIRCCNNTYIYIYTYIQGNAGQASDPRRDDARAHEVAVRRLAAGD